MKQLVALTVNFINFFALIILSFLDGEGRGRARFQDDSDPGGGE